MAWTSVFLGQVLLTEGRYPQAGSGNRTVLRSGHPPHLFLACGIDRAYIVFAAKEETELRTEFTACSRAPRAASRD